MRVLAIDPGLRTGWALGEPGRIPTCGTEELRPKAHHRESDGVVLLRFRRWLEGVLCPGCPWPHAAHPRRAVDLATFEAGSHRRGGAAGAWMGAFHGEVKAACAKHGVEWTDVNTQTIRATARAAGHRVRNKDDVLPAARAEWPGLADDMDADQADALWAWRWACDGLG